MENSRKLANADCESGSGAFCAWVVERAAHSAVESRPQPIPEHVVMSFVVFVIGVLGRALAAPAAFRGQSRRGATGRGAVNY